MSHALRLAVRVLVVLLVAVAVLATADNAWWLVLAAGISLYVAVGYMLWTTRGTILNIALVLVFFPILLPLAVFEWIRRRIARPQPS